jgi:hypothetical protein
MIEPAATARARGARSIASSLLAAVLAVCGIFTASALAASPRLPIIVYHQIRNTADGPPDNHPSLWWFFNKMKRLWLASLKRRSQTARLSWERFIQFVARFFPPIRTIHPLPCHRFDARTRGRSPVR